jgi:MFS family permease
MDHLGAVLGPGLALAVLALWPDDLRRVFLFAAIPGALAIVAILLGVREAPDGTTGSGGPSLAMLPSPALVRYLVPLGIFTLGNSSDAFLLLRAGGTSDPWKLPLLWMAFNAVQSAASTPLGRLSDQVGRRATILAGWGLYAAVYAGFALVGTGPGFVALFLVYGLFRAFTEGAEKALVAEVSPGDARGVGFGWYHLVSGLLTLPASILFGAVWDAWGPPVAFAFGASLALTAMLLLLVAGPTERAAVA